MVFMSKVFLKSYFKKMKKFPKIILIIIAAIIVLVLIVIGFGFLQREHQIVKLPDYYQELAKKCKETDSFSCCMASVKVMAGGGYKLAPETGCPARFQRNGLECIGSYQWCEPIEKVDYSKPAYFEYGKTFLVKSFKAGPSGGLFEINNTNTSIDGITIEIPKGALGKEIDFSVGYNDGVLKNVRGQWDGITGVLSSKPSVNLMGVPSSFIRIKVKHSGDLEGITPVPYAIDGDGKLHSLQLISVDRENKIFSFDTFYTPLIFTWIDAY